MINGLIVSTSDENRFGSGQIWISLSSFRSALCRVIVSSQTFPTLFRTHDLGPDETPPLALGHLQPMEQIPMGLQVPRTKIFLVTAKLFYRKTRMKNSGIGLPCILIFSLF